MTHAKIQELLNNKVSAGGEIDGGKILSDTNGEIYSDNILAFKKNGTLQILKSQLRQNYELRYQDFAPTPDVSFDQLLSDIRTVCSTNPHYMDIVDETDNTITFDFSGDLVPMTKELIGESEVRAAFKEYLNYYSNDTSRLKHWDSQTVYYDRDKKIIKIVDFATVWYSDIRPDRDVYFFGCHDDVNLYMFSFTNTPNADQQGVLARVAQMAADRNLEFKLIHIE